MSLKRTAAIEVDGKDFDATLGVTKAYEDDTGRRFIEGAATGVLEDLDGERVSKNGVLDMARQAVNGMKLTSAHNQDWATEIGDVTKVWHDPETDELFVRCELPPEGEDPLADKAWNRQTKHGERLAFSIGGKLEKAYYEQTDLGKRRKVLDRVRLKHFMLTKKPAYTQSFAVAVAKTFDGEPPDEGYLESIEEDDGAAIVVEKVVVEKDRPTSAVSQDADTTGYGGTKGKDSPKRDVNTPDDKKDDADPEPAEDLPKVRRLACPNCGHEFAADMPADKEPPPDTDGGDNSDGANNHERAEKSAAEETNMAKTIAESVEELQALVADEPVEKTETADEKPDEGAVEKQATDSDDVVKMIAASHRANGERLDGIESGLKDALGVVGKAIKGIHELLADMPQGRKSIARLQAQGTGTPTPAEVVEDRTVGKTLTDDDEVAKAIDEEDDPVAALRISNKHHFGV